ncbi:MAG TPA: CrcB family protein [Solirubrobacterales bacterium]|jgi:fluoride exporter|nr:CrcB family protein [Solirubrobacterales bacterium]
MTTLFVAVGGLIGVMGRYGLTRLTIHHDSLLWMTAAINISGSFVLGVLTAAGWFSRDMREGIGVGLLGGFTTFSTFSVQAVLDADAGEPRRAAGYVALSVVGGIGAATAGYVLGRRLA